MSDLESVIDELGEAFSLYVLTKAVEDNDMGFGVESDEQDAEFEF